MKLKRRQEDIFRTSKKSGSKFLLGLMIVLVGVVTYAYVVDPSLIQIL